MEKIKICWNSSVWFLQYSETPLTKFLTSIKNSAMKRKLPITYFKRYSFYKKHYRSKLLILPVLILLV